MNKDFGNTVAALLVGAIIGAGAGVLFAPDEGRKTRKKIQKSFTKKSNKLKDNLDELSENLKNKAEKLTGTLEENIENLLTKSNYKAEEAIQVLERKLEQLKKNKLKG